MQFGLALGIARVHYVLFAAARKAAWTGGPTPWAPPVLNASILECQHLRAGDLDALRKLVTCWRAVTEMLRKALGLDKPQEQKPNAIFQVAFLGEEPPLARTIEVTPGGALPATS